MLDNKVGVFFIKTMIALALFLFVLVVVALFGFILIRGLDIISLEFLKAMLPAIISTIYLVGVTLIFALPIGILSAIYLKIYAKSQALVQAISFTINCLAAMPSIVYGLFAVSLFLYFFRFDRSILIAGLTIGCLVLPIIIKNVEDAIENVSQLQIEASYALGATSLDTIIKVILPNCLNSIVTAISLSIGRIVGDVAAIMFVMGTINRIPETVFDSGISLATKLYLILQEPAFSALGVNEAYAIALVLILFIIILNLIVKLSNYYFSRGN